MAHAASLPAAQPAPPGKGQSEENAAVRKRYRIIEQEASPREELKSASLAEVEALLFASNPASLALAARNAEL
jgi:hypothetical protein